MRGISRDQYFDDTEVRCCAVMGAKLAILVRKMPRPAEFVWEHWEKIFTDTKGVQSQQQEGNTIRK